MGTYYIQEQNDGLTRVGRGEFYDTLNNGDGYLHYNEGGQHIALLRTDLNEATMRVCRQSDYAERDAHFAETRCRDDKGKLCLYQHDADGKIIRNEKSNCVHAKCGDCPRNGWIGGKRENCCIRNTCKIEDCGLCTKHREYSAPASLEWLSEEMGEYDDCGEVAIADPDADVHELFEQSELEMEVRAGLEQLTPKERSVIEAIFWGGLSQRECAAELGMSKSTVNRLYLSALAALKELLADLR